jgi:hypothetical protein
VESLAQRIFSKVSEHGRGWVFSPDDFRAKIVSLTDPSRTVRGGNLEISLNKLPRNMGPAGRTSGLVIQALRRLGKQHVDQTVIQSLKRKLNSADKKHLPADLGYAPRGSGGTCERLQKEVF